MSTIDYRNFVDINIEHNTVPSITSTRATTVCFVATADIDVVASLSPDTTKGEVTVEELLALLPTEGETEAKQYIHSYFANGGCKLHVLTASTTAATLQSVIDALPVEEIVIAYPGQTAALNSAMALVTAQSSYYGIKRKLAVLRRSDNTITTFSKDTIVKFSTKYELQATIAAYLSKIDISRLNSVDDYDFTIENVISAEGTNVAEDATNEVVTNAINNNENVDVFVAGQYRNIGGDTKDGKDLVNEYMLIVLQQTVTERVMQILTEKVKGQAGVAAIRTAIAEELNRYIGCGYIATDKVYKGETLSYIYNGQTYVLLEKNTPMLLGYAILVIPYSALTADDKAAHKAPPIYLAIADSYGIRRVDISGIVY